MNKKDIENFYDMPVWKDAHSLSVELYEVTSDFPNDERFGLTDQMRRAASSITANLAEGFGRYHYKDKVKFYIQARGSAMELQDHIFLAKDLEYIPEDKARDLFSELTDVIKQLNGLIKSTRNQLE